MEDKQPEPIQLEISLQVDEDLDYEDEDDYEDADYEDYEDHERRIAWECWQLPDDLSLRQEAANFYVLYTMKLDGTDEGKFDRECLPRLATLFANYSDMVIGGELRYACSQIPSYREVVNPTLAYRLASTSLGGGERHEAWEEWASVRQEFGTTALTWAVNAFLNFGSSVTYGGAKWAHIADTLCKFEQGEYSPLVFVDMCWSTEHNGGQFFGKLWNTWGIKPILDANQREDIKELLKWTSTNIRQFYVGVE